MPLMIVAFAGMATSSCEKLADNFSDEGKKDVDLRRPLRRPLFTKGRWRMMGLFL